MAKITLNFPDAEVNDWVAAYSLEYNNRLPEEVALSQMDFAKAQLVKHVTRPVIEYKKQEILKTVNLDANFNLTLT